MTDFDAALARATRAVLAVWTGPPGARRLLAVPSPVWWDGAGVWLAAPEAAEALRRQPACDLLVSGGGVRLAVRGAARVYGLQEPLALALHGPAIAGAMSALALRDVAGLRRSLPGVLPREVAVRVVVSGVERLGAEEEDGVTDGVAPALPAETPSPVRRALAGVRRVAVLDPSRPGALAAVWGGGLRLDGIAPGTPWCAAVAGDGDTGLALEGPVDGGGRLRPERAQWWQDGERDQAAVRGDAGAVVLPD